MNHIENELLKNLLQRIDTAVWCWNIKKATRTGNRCKVNWKSSLDDLSEAYWKWRIEHENNNLIPVIEEMQK